METYLASAGVSTGSIAILFLAYKVFSAIRGHRLISDCCGKFYEVGVDVRGMPPTPPVPGETQTHQISSPPEEVSSQSLTVSAPKEPERPPDLRKASSVRRHLPQRGLAVVSAPVSLAPSTSESKPSDVKLEGDLVSSVPPILLG